MFSGSYSEVVVTAVNSIDEGLKSVRFEGVFLNIKTDFVPGQKIEFRVSDTEYRHYTPSYFNQEEGVCEVLFYLHDKGPGSRWAAGLKKGDTLKMIGPGGKMRYDTHANIHILYGDETSLGLFHCMSEEAATRGEHCFCIAELDEAHRHWPGLVNVQAATVVPHVVFKAYTANAKLEEWLQTYTGSRERIAFYLTGNAKAIQAFRKNLLVLDFQSAQIQSDPYWAEGKCGL